MTMIGDRLKNRRVFVITLASQIFVFFLVGGFSIEKVIDNFGRVWWFSVPVAVGVCWAAWSVNSSKKGRRGQKGRRKGRRGQSVNCEFTKNE